MLCVWAAGASAPSTYRSVMLRLPVPVLVIFTTVACAEAMAALSAIRSSSYPPLGYVADVHVVSVPVAPKLTLIDREPVAPNRSLSADSELSVSVIVPVAFTSTVAPFVQPAAVYADASYAVLTVASVKLTNVRLIGVS